MNVYRANGFNNRSEYLESLADEYGIDIDTVSCFAMVLGPSEDFDGLVTQLEDLLAELKSSQEDYEYVNDIYNTFENNS